MTQENPPKNHLETEEQAQEYTPSETLEQTQEKPSKLPEISEQDSQRIESLKREIAQEAKVPTPTPFEKAVKERPLGDEKLKTSWLKRTAITALISIGSFLGVQGQTKKVEKDNLKKDSVTRTLEQVHPLTPQQMHDWNDFVSFIESKGMKGSKELDNHDKNLGEQLLNEYKKVNPKSTLDYGLVLDIQVEFQRLKEKAIAFEQRRGNSGVNIMPNISKPDGWLGSLTTSNKFPEMVFKTADYTEGLGLVGGNFESSTKNATAEAKKIPKGAKIIEVDGEKFYENPKTGDLIRFQ